MAAFVKADGVAAKKNGTTHEGVGTIATLGSERYEISDAFVLSD